MTKRGSAGAADGAARETPQWRPAASDAIERWLSSSTLEELELREQGGRAMYPETLKRRNPAAPGKLEEIEVLLRVPNVLEQARSRVMSLDWAKELLELDRRPTIEEAQASLGEVYWDSLDTICLLSLCIFDAEPLGDEHPRYMMNPRDLVQGHPHSALSDIKERLDHYFELESPRLDQVGEKEFHLVVNAIAKAGNAGPLVVIAGSAQASFITTMAVRLQPYLTEQSGSPSSET
jgi:hypothetical protein